MILMHSFVSIVEQIMIDIENEEFAQAYIKATSLYWDDSWSSNEKKKWDATRKAIIKQINEAEIQAGLEPSYTEESNWFLDLFR